MNIQLVEPMGGKTMASLTVKQGATKIIPASQDVVDDVAAFHDALDGLMKETTEHFSDPSPEWAKAHSDEKNALSQLKATKRTFDQCH